MTNLITLLAAAALMSLHCSVEANALLDDTKIDLDNNLQANLIPPQRKRLRRYVRISAPPQQLAVYVPGTALELACEAMGSPAPTIRWLKNDEPIVDYEEEANEIPSSHPPILAHLTSKLIVTSARDGDVFTCVATAGINEDSASSTILSEGGESPKLLEKLFDEPSKPIITSFYNDILQEIGNSVVLPCRAHSAAEHQLYWQDNREGLVYSNSRLRVLPSGDLLIAGLRWSDMGGWSCTVKNIYGKDSATAFLYPTKPGKQ